MHVHIYIITGAEPYCFGQVFWDPKPEACHWAGSTADEPGSRNKTSSRLVPSYKQPCFKHICKEQTESQISQDGSHGIPPVLTKKALHDLRSGSLDCNGLNVHLAQDTSEPVATGIHEGLGRYLAFGYWDPEG